MLPADIDKNIEKIDEISREINKIKNTIRKKRHKDPKHRELSLRANELMNSKTGIRNTRDAFKQIVSHIEEAKDQVKLETKQLKKMKNLPRENPFDFTEYAELQKEENEIDLALFFELAEENKIYKQVPINTLIGDMEKLGIGFFTNSYFTLGDNEGEIDTNGFFEDSNVLAKFIDKMLDKYDDHPSIYYRINFYRYFRNFKRVTRSEHGRGANEFNNIQE